MHTLLCAYRRHKSFTTFVISLAIALLFIYVGFGPMEGAIAVLIAIVLNTLIIISIDYKYKDKCDKIDNDILSRNKENIAIYEKMRKKQYK